MAEFNQPKSVILKETYVREVPLIIHRIQVRERNDTLDKLYDQFMNLQIAAATAGLGASPDLLRGIADRLEKAIIKITPGGKKETSGEQSDNTEQKLERLQQIIARTQEKKRR